MAVRPKLLLADPDGAIYDDPELLMVGSRAGQWFLPEKEDLIPLPPESELFLLPGRKAVGFNPESGQMTETDELAVAAFAAPGYTLSAHPSYVQQAGAPMLPLFAYGAVGYADDRFWICATRTDEDRRQQFAGVSPQKIEKMARDLLRAHPDNRLVGHIINNCVRRYGCPAAKNFALGRYEAPLPTSQACNARCVGCISLQEPSSPIQTTPQCRLGFTPKAAEIVEVMRIHEQREQKTPIYSFGQGCEGDPLANAELLAESVRAFRDLRKKGSGGSGTVNCNTNASDAGKIELLARSGLTSIRVSLNSARADAYEAYYRPVNYGFSDVVKSIATARRHGLFVSLNLLYFPGVTDVQEELEALADLCGKGVAMIQWRNLNMDPGYGTMVFDEALKTESADLYKPAMGLNRFMKSLKKKCPWLRYGYFNPWLGDRADLAAPGK